MAIDQIVLASTNRGKIAELSGLTAELGITVRNLADFPEIGEIEETGQTFVENALLKARAVALATGLTAIADDSGLAVDSLAGAPGIYSARYGDDWQMLPGENRDQRNIRKLLKAMAGLGPEQRKAHFETAIAAVRPDGRELIVSGQWHGLILPEPLGENGFGYDPVFWDPELGKSAAQLERAEKNRVSHRAKALSKLLARWPEFCGEASR